MTFLKPRSLRWRLTVRVIAAQIGVISILAVVQLIAEAYLWSNGNIYDGNNGWTAVNIVADSVTRSPHGQLSIDESDKLRNRLKNPEFWYVVRDASGQQISHGQVPNNVASAVNALDSIAYADLGQAIDKSETPIATVQWANSRAGVIKVMTTARSPVTFTEALSLASAKSLVLVVCLSLITLVISLIITPWVVKRTLAGMDKVAADAKSINFKQRGLRLQGDSAPLEIQPFIDAVNSAFNRLDEGYGARQRFLADAAHELRTPIAILQTRLSNLPSSAHKVLLQADLARLTNLATQLLDLQRYEQGVVVLQRTDLVELARTVVADIAPLAVAAGYDIALENEAEHCWVKVEAASIERALGNLIQNAITYAGQSGLITVLVGRNGTIDVIDEGPGIAEADFEKVFEPFHRLRNDGRGAGLGLELVQRIMYANGGRAHLLPGATAAGAHFRLSFGHPASQ
ncbi:sensor histidine kinase [Pseudomonas promysalinigenes]|uniref:histidine kinase n=1 Tax=Pseudomonas promysalinigenes TaxID=485898 RepID=A0ABY6AJT9_9PSED|nr:ATP-binding protein [Pseudomonas promysalinigenes]UXH39961.1 ATP-binding protein [Pseudomonas promysalinigenes]